MTPIRCLSQLVLWDSNANICVWMCTVRVITYLSWSIQEQSRWNRAKGSNSKSLQFDNTSQAGFIYGFYMLSLVRLAFRVHHVCRIFLLLCVSLQLGVTALSTVWLLELMQSQCGHVRYPASLISARADLIRLLQSKHTAASALEVCPERSAPSAVQLRKYVH